ncbi:MAG: hypothetical protein SGJ02_13560 [bacterium]|nr:hypothetical protein [bacterium]
MVVVGIIVGTYSTMYAASPIVIAWDKWAQARAIAKGTVGATSHRALEVIFDMPGRNGNFN